MRKRGKHWRDVVVYITERSIRVLSSSLLHWILGKGVCLDRRTMGTPRGKGGWTGRFKGGGGGD